MKRLKLTISIVFTLPIFIPTIVLALLSQIFRWIGLGRFGDMWMRFWLRITIWWIFICFGAKLIVGGKENLPKGHGERICFISNHQSLMDIPALFGAGVWGGVISKVELKKVPFLNWIMMELGCVFIDRKSIKESMKAILKGTENIKKGRAMLIFPEGTRSKTRELAEFKAGSFKMATKAQAKIIPIALQNTRLMFENAHSFRRIPVYVDFLEPVDTSTMTEEEIKEVHTLVENRIRAAYKELPKAE